MILYILAYIFSEKKSALILFSVLLCFILFVQCQGLNPGPPAYKIYALPQSYIPNCIQNFIVLCWSSVFHLGWFLDRVFPVQNPAGADSYFVQGRTRRSEQIAVFSLKVLPFAFILNGNGNCGFTLKWVLLLLSQWKYFKSNFEFHRIPKQVKYKRLIFSFLLNYMPL